MTAVACRRVAEGQSRRRVAKDVGLSRSRLGEVLQKGAPAVSRHAQCGARPQLSPHEARGFRRLTLANPKRTDARLGAQLTAAYQRNISRYVVRRTMRWLGINSQRPRSVPLLSKAHRRARRDYTCEHLEWSPPSCGQILFSDEKLFRATWFTRRTRVWLELSQLDHRRQQVYS